MSIETPLLPATFDYPQLRAVLDDYFHRLRETLLYELATPRHSVEYFGATGGAGVDNAAAIQAALDSGLKYVSAHGNYGLGSEFQIPKGVYFDASGATFTALTDTNLCRMHGGATLRGYPTFDVTVTGWNSKAVWFSGASEQDSANLFRIPDKTICEVQVIGRTTGTGNGTGVALWAEDDGVHNQWLMGVWCWAKVKGCDKAAHLYKQGTSLGRTFVNSNRLWIDAGNSLQALVLESDHANGYGVDLNFIDLQHQSRSNAAEHTLPCIQLDGQDNLFELEPIDWVGGSTGLLPAISVNPGARRVRIHIKAVSKTYVENLSAEDTVWIENDVDSSLNLPGGLNGSIQTLSGNGATNITSYITRWTTTGANTSTLADGDEGQIKIIVMVVDGGDGVLTPTNLANATTITFNDVGDSVTLTFLNGEWWVTQNNGAVVA